jgi:DNA-binding IclR family transcriptional regulator
MTRAERVAEMASVALPVFEADGTFIGAMVVLGLASRHNQQAQLKAADIVRRELVAQGFLAAAPADWRPPGENAGKAARRP